MLSASQYSSTEQLCCKHTIDKVCSTAQGNRHRQLWTSSAQHTAHQNLMKPPVWHATVCVIIRYNAISIEYHLSTKVEWLLMIIISSRVWRCEKYSHGQKADRFTVQNSINAENKSNCVRPLLKRKKAIFVYHSLPARTYESEEKEYFWRKLLVFRAQQWLHVTVCNVASKIALLRDAKAFFFRLFCCVNIVCVLRIKRVESEEGTACKEYNGSQK